MENPALGVYKEAEHIDLPPGFRFHPTDEELISHYLFSKTLDVNFTAVAIGEADFNKCEPWDLPNVAKMGEKEWYFFSLRDRKYPSGLRTNRATGTGYWKATGKDKEIYKARSLVGLKKTLVFYQGRAPKGEKSNWIMHEYRLFPSPDNSKNEWVICRVFHKSSSENKTLLSNETPSAAHTDQTQLVAASSSDVPCLSQLIDPAYSDIDPNYFSQGYYHTQINPFTQYTFGDYSDQNMLLGSAVENSGGGLGTELNQGNPVGSSAVPGYDIGGDPFGDQAGPSMGPVDIDSFWNF